MKGLKHHPFCCSCIIKAAVGQGHPRVVSQIVRSVDPCGEINWLPLFDCTLSIHANAHTHACSCHIHKDTEAVFTLWLVAQGSELGLNPFRIRLSCLTVFHDGITGGNIMFPSTKTGVVHFSPRRSCPISLHSVDAGSVVCPHMCPDFGPMRRSFEGS